MCQRLQREISLWPSRPRDAGLFTFVGLWDVWCKGESPVESCSIITTTASEATRHLHERMPVILDRGQFAAWLDPLTPQPELDKLLWPRPADRIELHPDGAAVGNVRNEGPEPVAPADLFTARVCAGSALQTPPDNGRPTTSNRCGRLAAAERLSPRRPFSLPEPRVP